MHPDQINFHPPLETVRAAYFTATQLQDFAPATQLVGVAMFMRELCAAAGVRPADLLAKVERMAADADTHYTRETKALRDYITKEIIK